MILRLLKRIREADELGEEDSSVFLAEDISVLYVECVEEETRISPLRISQTGRFIDRWPDGFFEERLGELDALLRKLSLASLQSIRNVYAVSGI